MGRGQTLPKRRFRKLLFVAHVTQTLRPRLAFLSLPQGAWIAYSGRNESYQDSRHEFFKRANPQRHGTAINDSI